MPKHSGGAILQHAMWRTWHAVCHCLLPSHHHEGPVREARHLEPAHLARLQLLLLRLLPLRLLLHMLPLLGL